MSVKALPSGTWLFCNVRAEGCHFCFRASSNGSSMSKARRIGAGAGWTTVKDGTNLELDICPHCRHTSAGGPGPAVVRSDNRQPKGNKLAEKARALLAERKRLTQELKDLNQKLNEIDEASAGMKEEYCGQ